MCPRVFVLFCPVSTRGPIIQWSAEEVVVRGLLSVPVIFDLWSWCKEIDTVLVVPGRWVARSATQLASINGYSEPFASLYRVPRPETIRASESVFSTLIAKDEALVRVAALHPVNVDENLLGLGAQRFHIIGIPPLVFSGHI
jgi:hypothetical protein